MGQCEALKLTYLPLLYFSNIKALTKTNKYNRVSIFTFMIASNQIQLHDIINEGQNRSRTEKERLSDDIRLHQSLKTLIEQSGISNNSQEKNAEKVAHQQLVSGDAEGHISTNIDVVSSPTQIHLAHVKRYQW